MFTCNVEEEITLAPDPVEVKARKNPFTTENIEQALQNVAARSNGRIKVEPPSTTHNYVRFMPQNLNQIMLIQDLGYELWDEPLDQEIEYEGDYYQQPGLPDSLNYFYTLIPVNYSIVQSVPHTIISQVVLFDEDAGDEQDPDEDPWIPDPPECGSLGCSYCYDEFGQPYICGTNPRVYVRQKSEKLPEDLLKKTTKYLLEGGVNLKELYNEALILAGYEDEAIDDTKGGRVKCARCYPAGRIMVVDNSVNSTATVPVKNVKVKAKRWFKIKSAYTNESGNFYINKGFRHKAKVIVKFKNDYAVVRGINGSAKLWQLVLPLRKVLGVYTEEDMENINYTFPYSANANYLSALQFAAAHVMSTLSDMRQYSSNNGLLGYAPGTEYKLNIWISSAHTQGASTPMLRSIANTSLVSNIIDYLLPLIGKAAKQVVQNYLPDVTIRLQDPNTGNTRFSAKISGTFFHEFAHTLHYNKVGNPYWVNLITAIVNNGGYGSKNSNNSGYVAVAESWGFFIGPTFNRTRYLSNTLIANEELNFLERQRNDNTIAMASYSSTLGYSRGWIPWGIHHDLIDSGEPSITLINDQVSGYTINGIFKGFHSGSTTVQNLRAAILANSGNSQATQVNTLVTGYGW